MFYLKYRPKTVDELDNSRIKEQIKKILEGKNLPHALLFIGQKGTGKTSTARIFAKAVNCLNNKFAKNNSSIEPCNSCQHCLSISNFSFVDVIEMDAASNRGIEEIKNLIRETSFLPMMGRYRVFIIDEAHMITPDGFNALLKTLEEPPKTVIFILATTSQEKIPPTIASRCLRINFGKAKKEDILSMLKRIVKKENLAFDESILKLIANYSENSFRDAAKILEELVIQNIKTVEETETFLGIRGKQNFLEILEKKDIKLTLSWLNQFAASGGNFKNLIETTLEELRLLLLFKKGVVTDLIDKEPINYFSLNLTAEEITYLIKLLMEAYQNLKITPIESLPLEIAVCEFYNKK